MTFAPIRRQKAFEGSFRQRRSRLLKRLAAGAVTLDAVDRPALDALVGDGLAVVDGGRARLPTAGL
jgi:hypothetical protein